MKQRKNPIEGFYSISQVANLLHVSTHTIRNLEREFSLEVTKDKDGNRVYNLETIEKYRVLIEKKNESKFSKFNTNQNIEKINEFHETMSEVALSEVAISSETVLKTNTSEIIEDVLNQKSLSYNKNSYNANKKYSQNNSDLRNLIPPFSPIHLVNLVSRFFGAVSFTVILLSSLLAFGIVSLNTYLKNFDVNNLLLSFNRESMSNVLQSTSEDWTYRFDVNVPAYVNNSLSVSGSLAGSNANFQIITVGQVLINQGGISAPNVVNLISTKSGESVILVDNSNRNQPIISLAANPTFENVTINSLNGVSELDETTIQTIQDNIDIPTPSTDAQTLSSLTSSDFLRSNANTIFTGGTLEFGATSSVKFSNLSSNTFLRLNSQNVLTSFDITAGDNITLSSTASSLVISASTGASSNIFNSAAVKDLYLGTSSFDEAYRVISTASELNKLHTLSGNIITSNNLSANIFTQFPNIDTNSTDDIISSNLASNIFNLFPNIDTNALNDLDNAVLTTSLGGKNIYSTNIWYGLQDFSEIKADNLEIASNGYIKLLSGSVPVITNSSLYNSGNRLYFEDLPLVQMYDSSISSNVNKLAYFVTNASGQLFVQGTNNIALNIFESGSNGQIIGVFGNSTKYLTVVGDLNVSTTSSSQITFQLNNVNTNPGTFGSDLFIPQITVNSKGQITSITTVASSSNNFVSSITFSTPVSGSRTLLLERFGLSTLNANFSMTNSDITTALGYTPLRASDTSADKFINSFGLSTTSTSQNVSYFFSIARNDGTTFPVNFALTPSVITTALGYTPLGASDTSADKFINSVGLSTNLIPQNVTYTLTIGRSDLAQFSVPFYINTAVVTTALGYIPLRNSSDSMSGNLVVTGTISAGSIFINGNLVCDASGNCSDVYVDTTNPNNYATGISFSDGAPAQKTLTLNRFGLSNLTATFSVSQADITTALGYTPLRATDTLADKFINSFGIDRHYISQNLELNFSLGRSDGTVILASTYLTPKEITTALGYIPLQASDTAADKFINSYGVSTSFLSQNVAYNFSIARNDGTTFPVSISLTPSVITTALGYTPLQATDTSADKFINSFGLSTTSTSQNVSYFFSIARNDGTTFPVNFALTPSVITTALGYTPLGASDTVPSYFVTSINFSDAAANTKVFTLERQGTNALSAIFSMSSSDITTALGYTPLNSAGGTISGNLTITGSLSANRIFQNGNAVCDLSGNCDAGKIFGSGISGFLSLFNATSSISNSVIYQSVANGYIGINTTNPGEQLDVYGAIKLSQNMGTEARNNSLYQDGGVLYWNGQVVGVVGSTAPGGISGTKDFIPYFNTKDTLIASELFYESGTTERSIELIANTVIPTYLGIGHKNDYSLRLGVAAGSTNFYTRYDSEDDVILQNVSNSHTSDLIFANENNLGKILFLFGKNADQTAPFAMTYSAISTRGSFGINTTSPNFNLEVIGTAKVSETFAASTFSNPNSNNFLFLSGANFRGNLSAGSAYLSGLTLANALGVSYGGTGLSQTPANGQLLIGSNGGYALAPITAGDNITISTSAGGITINAVLGGTNANNNVNAIAFSNPANAQKTLILSRDSLSDLTATFSISQADITTALGYTPLQASDTVAEKFINSYGVATSYNSQNVAYNFSIARNDGTTFPVSISLTPSVITTALGYTPLQATDTEAEKYINSFGLSTTSTSQNVSYFFSIARNDGTTFPVNFALTPSVITTALGYTPLQAIDTSADLFINSISTGFDYISQNVQLNISLGRSDLTVLNSVTLFTPSVITTALGYTPLSASDTVPSYFVTSINFSDASANTKVFTLERQGTNALSSIFSLSLSDVTTALGYTPLQATDTSADKFINSFGLSTTSTSQNVSFLFSIARNDGTTLPVSFALTPSVITTALGYTPLGASDTVPSYFITSINFSDASANTKVITLERQGTNPLSAIFSLSSSDITSSLTYTPVNKAGDSISGNLVVAGTLAGNKLFQNGFMVCDDSGNCSISISDITTALGYTPLRNTDDTLSGTLVVTETLSAVTLLQNGNTVCDTSGNCSNVYVDTTNANNFVTSINFSDAAANTKVFTLERQGTNALSAIFSLSSSDITSALTYTPVNKAGDSISGSLFVGTTLSARHLFLADTQYSDKYLHIDPNLGNFNSKLILDLNAGSSINTTLGMYIQSAKFSSALGTTNKNLTFNVIDSELGTRIDILRTGTIPSIYQGSVDFYGASLLGANASFDNLGVTYDFSAGTGKIFGNFSAGNSTLASLSVNSGATVNGNLSASTAFINGYFSAGSSSLAGLSLTSELFGTSAVFSGNVTMASANVTGNLSASTAFINGYFSAGNSSIAALTLTGTLNGTSANFSGNASFASAFVANDFSVSGTGFFNTVATGVFSTPLATNMFTFLGGANFTGNISAANGTFLTLSAQSLNINNLFTVDSTGSVFNNNVTFNDTIEFNAVGDLGVANDLVFTNTTLAKIKTSNDLIFDIGEPYNSSNLTVNVFNSGEFVVNGSSQFNGNQDTTGTVASSNIVLRSFPATGVTTANVCRVTSTGLLGSCTSSIKYKESVEDLTLGLAEINMLRPVQFKWKGDGKSDFGFVAEEVNLINPMFAEYSESGEVTGVRYMILTSLLTKGIQEQQAQISSMSSAIASFTTIDFSQASSMYTSIMNTIDALSMSTDNGDLVVGTDLIVNGKTIMNDATFTGNVQVGQMAFNTLENSLNVLGASCVRPDGTLDDALCQTQSLFLMKNKAGNLNIFDGKVVLKPNGDMQVEKINVTEIKADEYKVASTSQVSGTETLLANQSEIVINTTKVKSNSKIFVTASNNLEGKTLYVDEKIEGVSFKVKINQSMTTDVKFDWFILNVE